MHHFSIPIFPNAIQLLNGFNQCANVHGHIHTQFTLALIFILLYFVLGTFPLSVGSQPTYHHMDFSIHIHYYSRIVPPTLR
jgi:hypothetical protein